MFIRSMSRLAAQSEIRVGYNTGITYNVAGLYYKLTLVNYSLGGGGGTDLFNRLNKDLRD